MEFKTAEPILLKVARALSKQNGGTFEPDELVNEAWIRGKLYSIEENFEHLTQRVRHDMLSYMRDVRKGRRKNPPTIVQFEFIEGALNGSERGAMDEGIASVVYEDMLDYILRRLHFNIRSERVFGLWLQGYDTYEIAGIVSMSQPWVSIKLKEIKERVRRLALECGMCD